MKFIVGFAALFVSGLVVALSVGNEEKHRVSDDVVRAKRFELIDKKGRVRIEMRMDNDDPVLSFKDVNGRDRVIVFQRADATGMYIKDISGDNRVGLAQFPHGGGLAMHGENGKGSAVYVLMNDKARLDIYNQKGKLSDRWPSDKND